MSRSLAVFLGFISCTVMFEFGLANGWRRSAADELADG